MGRIQRSQLWKEVDRILFEVWDPIGINGDLAARDEYQGYVPQVLAHVEKGGSESSLSNLLGQIERERMQLDSGEDHRLQVASLIVETFESSGNLSP
ncbi:MAG TPA: hypothetical protein PKA27_06220 [Fimbriimonadaceae bacterium]|nr:hypothetical protein [Fimbriimonadaceae bacterium]